MTKAELIKALESYPNDIPILVEGYEGGYDHLELRAVELTPDLPKVWYQGEFTWTSLGGEDTFPAVVLISTNRNSEH